MSAAAAAALPMSWGDLAEEAPMTRSASPPRTPSPPPRAAAAPGAPRKAPGKLPYKSAAPSKPKPAPKPATKPVPRGFALLAEVSDEEEETPAPTTPSPSPVTTAPTVVPKPAPVVKMPTMMTEEELEAEENKGRTCLRIANLPMDITKRKLEDIFSEFTGFDQVTLPLKFGKPRGFAFVDFRCPDDAADCLYSVRGSLEIKGKRVDGQTHLVVVEYARNNIAPTRA